MTSNNYRKILQEISNDYQNACILQAAAELDLFTALLQGGNRLTAEELSAALQTNCRATEVLLDALTAADFLQKKGRMYSVAEIFSKLLDSRTAETFIPMLRHLANVQRAWVQLAKTVKTGVLPQVEPSILGADEDQRSFIWAMNSVAHTLAEPAVESLRQAGLLTFRKMIDIGGASGTYTLAFLKAMPELSATIFDLPVGIAAAQKRFLGSEYEKRVHLVEGDIFQNDFPIGFDFVWISAVIHQFGREENLILYKKAFAALETGGKIAVRDFVMNEARTAPKAGTFFGINMLVETPHGQVYSFNEVREDLESAGFKEVRLAIPAETMSAIIVATKCTDFA